jgi:HEAT repeat protein
MSAALPFRLLLLLLLACLVVLSWSRSSESELTPKHTEKQAPVSAASPRAEAQDQGKPAQEPVTIPNPSLPPLDGAWQLLETGVKSDKVSERAIAIRALGLVHNNARAIRLAETGVDDGKPEVRAAAADALGRIGSKKSIPTLKKMLDDKDPKVVLSAAQALIELKDDEGYEVYYEILTGERKAGGGLMASEEAMFKDPKQLLGLGFHEGLGFIPFGGISWEAYKTITKNDTSPLRAAAARKLAQDPDPAATKALITAAGDKNWLVRAAALEALALRGDSAGLKTAALYLYDERAEVKYTAAGAVIRLSRTDRKSRDPKRKD